MKSKGTNSSTYKKNLNPAARITFEKKSPLSITIRQKDRKDSNKFWKNKNIGLK
jgi:hypothetical protein